MAVACCFAVLEPRLGLLDRLDLGLLGLGHSFGPDPGCLGDVGLEPLRRLIVVLGRLGQHGRCLGICVVMDLLQLGHGLLPLGGHLLADLGGLALDRTAQILGVQIGVLPGGLGLVVGFAAH